MKKSRFVILYFFVFSFLLGETNFLLGKNIIDSSKATENPYVPYNSQSTTYSNKSFDIYDDNNKNLNGDSIFYLQVFDNSSKTFENFIKEKYETNLHAIKIFYEISNGGNAQTFGYFTPTLSDINNSIYSFYFNVSEIAEFVNSFIFFDVPFGLGSSSNTDTQLIDYTDVNDNSKNQANFSNYEPVNNVYPFIKTYNTNENNDIFKMDSFENGELIFTIKASNWIQGEEAITDPENKIGVTLIDKQEKDEFRKYEQYEANLISNDQNHFTYKISGLNIYKNYQFYSLNYTGLTVGNSKYNPNYEIRLEEDLSIPYNKTLIVSNPIIDNSEGNGFKINENSITEKSVEFTIKVVDTFDNKFYNSLIQNSNNINITLINNSENIEIQTQGSLVNIKEDYLYTFKIKDLQGNRNYTIYSLNDANLMNNWEFDPEIIINDDLGISNNTFTTRKISRLMLAIISIIATFIGILILLVILRILRKNRKEINQKK